MGFFEDMFDPELMFYPEHKQRADIRELKGQMVELAGVADRRIPALERQISGLMLLCNALVEVIERKGIATREELEVLVQQIDLLDGREDGMHLGQLTDDRMIGCSKYFLAIRSGVPEQQAATTLPRLSKMASWGDINSILSAATPGAPVEVTFRPPPEIPIKAGVVYFAIAIENNYWRNIVTDRQIAVYLPRPFEPGQTKVELLGIPRKA